jgi:hypothetical protein
MNNLDLLSETVSQISQLVSQKLPQWFGEGATLLTPAGVVEARLFSYLIRYQVRRPDGKNLTIIAKFKQAFDTSDSSTSDMLRQTADMRQYYDTLTEVARIFANKPAHCYIRPVDYLSQYNAIIMEELPSHSLRDEFVHPFMIVGLPSYRRRFLAHLAQTGSWLRIYHEQFSGITNESSHKADLEAIANKKLDYLHAVTRGHINTSNIEQSLAYWLDRITNIQVPHAQLHKDYNYANVFITPDGRIGSLDIKPRYGAIYEDLAHLIIDGYTGKWQLLSHGHIFRPDYLLQCQNAIIQGYFHDAPLNNNLLNFYCTLASLNKWIYTEKNKLQRPSTTNKIFTSTIRRYLHRLPSYFTTIT